MPDKNTTQPPRKIKLIIISVIIGLLGGILMIGIPGALVLQLIGLAYSQLGIHPFELSGDSVWPIAIMISLLWPAALTPLSFFHYKNFPTQSLVSRWLFSLFGSLVITIFITFFIFL